MIVQKLKTSVANKIVLAERYYSFLSIINDFHLTQREVQLLAFTAVRGNITNGNVRDEFCKSYKTTTPTVNNIVSKLRKKHLLVKDENKMTRVNPAVVLDFEKDLTLAITLIHKK